LRKEEFAEVLDTVKKMLLEVEEAASVAYLVGSRDQRWAKKQLSLIREVFLQLKEENLALSLEEMKEIESLGKRYLNLFNFSL